MKNRILLIMVMFLLVIAIAYAGVLSYYGKITGTADVSANPHIVLWLPFDDSCTADDISQYSNNGALKPDCPTNSPSWTAGKIGTALDFDGVDDYVDCGTTSLDITDAITMEAWVKLNTDGTDAWYDILRKDTGYEVSVSRDSGTIEVALNDGSWHWYDSLSKINLDDTWYHIAVTWEKTTGKVKIYINGNLDAELNGITTSLKPSGNFWVGGKDISWSSSGAIDEPRIWDIALSDEQIQSIYEKGAGE